MSFLDAIYKHKSIAYTHANTLHSFLLTWTHIEKRHFVWLMLRTLDYFAIWISSFQILSLAGGLIVRCNILFYSFLSFIFDILWWAMIFRIAWYENFKEENSKRIQNVRQVSLCLVLLPFSVVLLISKLLKTNQWHSFMRAFLGETPYNDVNNG